MASDNKTLGRFELTGIAPAPRGVPQIEVTFDIDANGIVEVSAKDKATGQQQVIRITASSGLTQSEIDRLIKDARLHADEDRQRKQLADARNQADALIYATEKSIAALGAKIDGPTRMEVDDALTRLKRAVKGEDELEIKRLTEILTRASHKLAEVAYQTGAADGAPGSGQRTNPHSPRAEEDDVVDAQYEEAV
jgi:molecular chaperone DnaK